MFCHTPHSATSVANTAPLAEETNSKGSIIWGRACAACRLLPNPAPKLASVQTQNLPAPVSAPCVALWWWESGCQNSAKTIHVKENGRGGVSGLCSIVCILFSGWINADPSSSSPRRIIAAGCARGAATEVILSSRRGLLSVRAVVASFKQISVMSNPWALNILTKTRPQSQPLCPRKSAF